MVTPMKRLLSNNIAKNVKDFWPIDLLLENALSVTSLMLRVINAMVVPSF
jgi:hypothetical protein